MDNVIKLGVAMLVVLAGLSAAIVVEALTREPVQCFQAPDVVRGWHSISAHPETRMVCGWHDAAVRVPVFRCVRMQERCP
jgi:hypothetical protein